ncbi:hypothetical protein [Pedobacter punctiformis]|uniref:Uncharacterized protein n=1 Tax=Pedobacter punctiformis TaxID=3004097 RepID=A0ABT4L5U5_9SPHI|nr:hypothetical protein [Pedobacter sp. HCMS5-2]MCZ4243300.1 hypothetical protein [Pedobacter sp. HCMS5-2]
MATYKTEQKNGRYFCITAEDKEIGVLVYKQPFNTSNVGADYAPLIDLPNKTTYYFERNLLGWSPLKRREETVLEYKFQNGGKTAFRVIEEGIEREFTLYMAEGYATISFHLSDEKEQHLLEINAVPCWWTETAGKNYTYTISSSKVFEELPFSTTLVLTVTHFINLRMFWSYNYHLNRDNPVQ